MGSWLITDSKVTVCPIRDITFPSDSSSTAICGQTAKPVLFDFAITSDQAACVIAETDLEGHVRRAAYSLPHGGQSHRVGACVCAAKGS